MKNYIYLNDRTHLFALKIACKWILVSAMIILFLLMDVLRKKGIIMATLKQLIKEIEWEKGRKDKLLQKNIFEVREQQVIMFFEYDEVVDNIHGNPYAVKHHHDPEFIELEEMETIKQKLSELHIPYSERRDVFM